MRNCLIAMGKLQFSATERRKFKAEGDKHESGKAGRKHLSAGQICCIKASGLSPVGTEKGKSFKQENMIIYQILIQIRFSEFQIKSSKLMLTIFCSEFYQNVSKASITTIKKYFQFIFLGIKKCVP